jgi:TPR repeat protein
MSRRENLNCSELVNEPVRAAGRFNTVNWCTGKSGGLCTLATLLSFVMWLGCSNQAPAPPTVSPEQIPAITAKAEKGDAEAQKTLGMAYAKGEGVQQDYRQAAKWYEQAAGQSNSVAQAALGELYEAGQGVPRDDVKAAEWYRRAAEQGYASAQYNLAALYAVGRGVPLNNTEALKWYLQAANQGDSLAQYNVGMRYFEGHGVKPDPVQAYKWLSLSAAQKLPDAARALSTLKYRISSEDLAKGRDLIRGFKLVGTTNR